MPSLSDTLARLSALSSSGSTRTGISNRLSPLNDFGSNPGALNAYFYAPETMSPPTALVVVLHGCTQNALDYDRDAGWSQLADELGFAVLLPEQRRSNNANLCFNWYETTDGRRDAGEPLSIWQMVATMIERHNIALDRVFINGLSAGGAMTSVMLATYPEVFAGGAIIAGLPFGTAAGVSEALGRMRGQPRPDGALLGASVLGASAHNGPWPTISIWHGSADYVVDPSNADAILAQWRSVHGLVANPSGTTNVDGQTRRVWRDALGTPVVEDFRIAGMGHGTPLATSGRDACGASGPHMLETGISSTRHIARFWGLAEREAGRGAEGKSSADVIPLAVPVAASPPKLAKQPALLAAPAAVSGVGKVIEDALRSADLMR